jgi:polysaccharide pyruvyl transferase WcaK-like protein
VTRRRVLIVNQHGDNRGDEAALHAMLRGIEKRVGDVDFTVIHQFADASAGPALRRDVEWIPLRIKPLEGLRIVLYVCLRVLGLRPKFVLGRIGKATIAAYESADVVVSAPGGPYFGDLYAGHEPVHWLYVWMARLHRKPCLIYATSAGPFRLRWANPFRRWTYRLCDRVIVREEISAQHIRSLFGARRRSVEVEVTIDAALQESVDPAPRGSRQRIVVSAINWAYKDDVDVAGRRENYDVSVVEAIVALVGDAQSEVVFVPQLHGSVHRDTPYLEKLVDRLVARNLANVEVSVFDERNDMLAQRALFASADWVIAGRYHPAVFALSAGVPQLCLPYEHKATGVMAAAGLSDVVVPIEEVTPERLVEVVTHLKANRDDVAARSREAAVRLGAVSARTSDAVADLVRNRPSTSSAADILMIGSFDPMFGRNRQLVRLAELNGWSVRQRSFDHWGDKVAAASAGKLRSGLRLLVAQARIIGSLFVAGVRIGRRPKVVLVPHPSQIDAVTVGVICKVLRLSMVIDYFVSLHETVVEDRGLVSAVSPIAGALRRVDAWAARLADVVLVDTPEDADAFAQATGTDRDKWRVVWVGADPGHFAPRDDVAVEPRSVLFYGTYIPLQGIEHIIHASLVMPADYRVRIVGDGQERSEMERLAARLSAPVEFVDQVPESDLSRLIAGSMVCLGVFGAGDKTQRVIPNKVFQCLAVGRPVITGDTPATSRLSGVVDRVPVADPQAIASAVQRLMEDPVRREALAAKGREYFAANYSDAAVAPLFGQALQSVLSR